MTRTYVLCSLGVALCHYAGFSGVAGVPATLSGAWPSSQPVGTILQLFNSGTLSLSMLTNLYFFCQYSTSLEVASDSAAEFVWDLLVIICMMMGYSTWVYPVGNPSPLLRDVLLYLWTKLEPDTEMAFAGIFIFKACYFPWMIVFLSKFIGSRRTNLPSRTFNWRGDFAAILIGHAYWFVRNELPRLHSIKSPLMAPWKLFEGPAPQVLEPQEAPPPQDNLPPNPL